MANAERRAIQMEVETRRESEREREERFQEIEGKIGAVTERASGASLRARATEPEPAAEVEAVTEEWTAAPSPEAETEAEKPEEQKKPKRRLTRRRRKEAEPDPAAEAAGAEAEPEEAERKAAEEEAERLAAEEAADAEQWVVEETVRQDAESDVELFDQEGASEPGEPATAAEPVAAAEPPPDGMLSLNQASFDELRGLGMSITQAKRVLRFGEEKSFSSVDELDGVPGFSKDFLERVKGRLVP